MRYEDWKYLGSTCGGLGVLLLIGGIGAYAYSQTLYLFGQPIGTVYPWRDYAVPLIIFGVVLLVIGIASFVRAEEERELEVKIPKPISVPLKKCPKCGTKFSLEYENCPRCKVKLVEDVVTKPKVEGKFFCRYCGKENKPDAVYCEGCGKKL